MRKPAAKHPCRTGAVLRYVRWAPLGRRGWIAVEQRPEARMGDPACRLSWRLRRPPPPGDGVAATSRRDGVRTAGRMWASPLCGGWGTAAAGLWPCRSLSCLWMSLNTQATTSTPFKLKALTSIPVHGTVRL